MPFPKHPLADRDILFNHVYQRGPGFSLVWFTRFPTILRPPVPGPPGFLISLPVQSSFAGDSDILLTKRVDQWRVVHQLHAFPTTKHERQVIGRILTKLDGRRRSDVQIDVALQMNRASEKRTSGHYHPSAAGSIARRDSPSKCFRAISRPVTNRSVARDYKTAFGKN